MYSGSDSTESANYSQWPLNPTFFQNMPNEHVDWAALAQQWIQMKEAGPPIPEPKPPESKKENNGEREKEILPPSSTDGVDNPSWNNISSTGENFDNSWNWKTQQNWDWNNTWNSQPSNPQIATRAPKSTLLPTPKGYASLDSSNDNSSVNAGYATSRNSDYSSGFSGHSTNHSRHYKPHNRRYSKVNVPKTVTPAPPVNIPSTSETETNNLDASKRKQLPAWIREGLEKMERDKLKQLEKDKEREKESEYSEKVKEQEKETMEILKDTIKERRKSKFDSDEEQSPKRTERMERFREEPEPLNHDELMLLVRRKMTEILLKVTNEAIQSICTEERQRYIKKIQTFGRGSGKINLSAKLGLGMYGSDSGSESDESEPSRRDSDDELKSAIKKKKADFIQTEKGIEDKLLQAEQKKGISKVNEDEEEEEHSSDNELEERATDIKKDEEINVRNKTYINVKQHRDSSRSSEESDKESSRRRSSSRSRESSLSTRRKHRSRSRERYYTPEKRKRHKSPKRSRSRSYDRKYSSDYKYKKEKSRSDRSRRSRSRSRTSRRSRSRSSSYKSRRSSETSSRSRRKRSRSPYHSRSSKRSRSRSHNKSSRTR